MDRGTRSPARFIAPLALIAVVVALLGVVSGSGDDGAATSTTTAPEPAETTRPRSAEQQDRGRDGNGGGRGARAGPRTYTVKPGDTLGSIADRTGVPLARIEELNPDVDPQAMVAGQKIKLR